MQVISQTNDYTFNFRNHDVKQIDNMVSVVTNFGSQVIGFYRSEARSQEVFRDMITKNMRLGVDEIYKMSKE